MSVARGGGNAFVKRTGRSKKTGGHERTMM